MDPVFVPVLAALVGLAMRGIAIAELLVRLRWQERRQRAHHSYLTALARTLPPGCRVDEVQADGSELHLVIIAPEPSRESIKMIHSALVANEDAPGVHGACTGRTEPRTGMANDGQ